MLFLGEYQHSLDVKGRLILPSKFRPALAEGAVIVATNGNCLAVHPLAEFETVAAEVGRRSKDGPEDLAAARAFSSSAEQIELDKQGRVPIPSALRNYAGLEREAVVIGAISRVEIWDIDRWREQKAAGQATLAVSGGFGI